jgi:nitroimidazol reductase NimA-like FMN-containing flavoprotein (pyridoxamine 5'-phosphate oxidase superfamily)
VLIQELTRQACLDLLARTRLGRLACAEGNQPYVVPVYFVYDEDALYIFSTVGRKIEWMRANPVVCVEAGEVVSAQQWVSVLVFGRYEELLDTPEWQGARAFAYRLLQQNAMWWEPAYVKRSYPDTQRPPLVPVFYRIHVVQITGYRATSEAVARPVTRLSGTDSGENGWVQRLLRQVRAKLKA